MSDEETPRVDRPSWTFRCFGLVEQEVSWTWTELHAENGSTTNIPLADLDQEDVLLAIKLASTPR
jgi:DMSO/TMAO reductase YedYZ molybdopterin-dependent catalytic subunit